MSVMIRDATSLVSLEDVQVRWCKKSGFRNGFPSGNENYWRAALLLFGSEMTTLIPGSIAAAE